MSATELKHWHSENRKRKHSKLEDLLYFPTTLSVKKIHVPNISNLNNAVDLMLVLKKILKEVAFSLSFILFSFVVVLVIKKKSCF